MKIDNNLHVLYDAVIESEELTTKKLNEIGFKSNDITKLLEKGIITRVKRGFYSFQDVDSLYNYGINLSKFRNYEKAKKCFEKCFEINKHLGASFRLFFIFLENNDFEKAFEYFNYSFNNTSNEYHNVDSNYYLFLLGMITNLPDNYKSLVKTLTYDDIKIKSGDRRFSSKFRYNNVRLSCYNQRFSLAYKQLSRIIEDNGRATYLDEITKTLIGKAMKKQLEEKELILSLIHDKKYKDVVETIENIEIRHDVSFSDKYVLLLSKLIMDLNEGKEIPYSDINNTSSIFTAIRNGNYNLALELSNDYLSLHNIDPDSNSLNVLLREIIRLLNIKNDVLEENTQENDNVSSIGSDDNNDDDNTSDEPLTNSVDGTFDNIISYLLKSDIDSAFKCLKEYLSGINKLQYEFLIIDLIKLSLVEKDISFSRPLMILAKISNDDYEFNIKTYIRQFYDTLSECNFDEARIYLDIISKAEIFGCKCDFIEELRTILNGTEALFTDKIIDKPVDKIVSSPVEKTSSDNLEKPQQIINNPQEKTVKKSIFPTPVDKFDAKSFVQEKMEDLYKNGVVLLKPMSDEQIRKVLDIVKDYSDVVTFEVGSANKKQLVLRYKPDITEYVNFKELAREGSKAYRNNDFHTCIKYYRSLLEVGTPSAFVYAFLGLSYMKLRNVPTAIEFLTIATELSKKDDKSEFDFSDLLLALKGEIDGEDKKPKVYMRENEFFGDVDDNFGIDVFDEIRGMLESGISFDEVCDAFSLSEEEKALSLLILARESYIQEEYDIGDLYLRKVEKIPNKSEIVKKQLDEIRRNKKFYRYRVNEGEVGSKK